MRRERRFSIEGRVVALVAGNVLFALVLSLGLARLRWLESGTAWLLTLLVALPTAVVSSSLAFRNLRRSLAGLSDGVRGFRDHDFSLRLAHRDDNEVGDLVAMYNEVGDALRLERNTFFQKELLLDTILQGAPLAVVLTNPADRIIYSNRFARELFRDGQRIDGEYFHEIRANSPEPLREALSGSVDTDALISMGSAGGGETFHLSRRTFWLNTQRHTLYLIKRLTPELRRQEVEIWKKTIRLMNHELNNSIAPISSLIHSARHVISHPEHAHRIDEIFGTIEERLSYLRSFLDGYAQFARLPGPRKREVPWVEFLEGVRPFCPFTVEGTLPPQTGWFDPAQMQQVLINLLTNAHEAGSAPENVHVAVNSSNGSGVVLEVLDRGRGMNAEEMERATLPFYSSKVSGTGLGLALSCEIIEAHGGHVRLRNREGGGVVVSCWLPAAPH